MPLIRSTATSLTRLTQSHNTWPDPAGTSSARWPMANAGVMPTPIRPASSRNADMWLRCRRANVVQCCPRGGTYCRSSSQMAQASGAADVGVYCVPQAVQMNASMIIRSLLEDRADMLSKCVRYLQAIVLVWLIEVNA